MELPERFRMEKAGLVYDCDIVHSGMPRMLYRLSLQAWRTAPAVESRSPARVAAAEQAVEV
jgi:hypothetical protein